jgi:hypothetical protein
MAPTSGYVSLLSWCETLGYPPRPTWWESRVAMPVKNMAVIMFAMIVCTSIMITMFRGEARNATNHFTQTERDNIPKLSLRLEAQAMKEHDTFLFLLVYVVSTPLGDRPAGGAIRAKQLHRSTSLLALRFEESEAVLSEKEKSEATLYKTPLWQGLA